MPANITRTNELVKNYFASKQKSLKDFFTKYFIENVTNNKALSALKFRSEGNSQKNGDKKTLNLKWWAYILMVLLMFLLCLLLNYIIKKVNEHRADDRFMSDRPKKTMSTIANTSRASLHKTEKPGEKYPTISMIYTKEDNATSKDHNLGMGPNAKKAAGAPTIDLPIIQNKSIKLTSSDNLNPHSSIDSKAVHSICSVINIKSSKKSNVSEKNSIVERKTETVKCISNVEILAQNEFKAKLLLSTDDDVKSVSVKEITNDLEIKESPSTINERVYNKFLGSIYSNRNVSLRDNVNEGYKNKLSMQTNTISSQSKDSQKTLKSLEHGTVSNITLQNKLSHNLDDAVKHDNFKIQFTPRIGTTMHTTRPNISKSNQESANTGTELMNNTGNYVYAEYEKQSNHQDDKNQQAKKEVTDPHVSEKKLADNSTRLIYQDFEFSKDASIISKPSESVTLLNLPTKMIQLVGTIGARFLDGVSSNVPSKPYVTYGGICQEKDTFKIKETQILFDDSNRKESLMMASRSEDVCVRKRSANYVTKCNSYSDTNAKVTIVNKKDSQPLETPKVISKDTTLRKRLESTVQSSWDSTIETKAGYHKMNLIKSPVASVRKIVSDNMSNHSYSLVSGLDSDAVMILNGSVVSSEDCSNASTTTMVKDIVDLLKKTAAKTKEILELDENVHGQKN